jgi:hypothetical protein
MICIQDDRFTWRWRIAIATLFILSFAAIALSAMPALSASPAQNIMAVDEHWELVIGTPSPNADAPQITCVISPNDSVDFIHAAFIVNHHDTPEFTAGGLQLQIWDGESMMASQRAPNEAVLSHPGEKITWTQRMRIHEGNLIFEVVDGTSTTWGNFGGIQLSMATDLQKLNQYDPQVSVEHSGISYAANRVQSLTLKGIRVLMSDGSYVEDATVRSVYPKTE